MIQRWIHKKDPKPACGYLDTGTKSGFQDHQAKHDFGGPPNPHFLINKHRPIWYPAPKGHWYASQGPSVESPMQQQKTTQI